MLAIIMLVTTVTGCNNRNGSTDDADKPEFVYVPEVMPFPMPEDVNWINQISVSGDTIYLTTLGAWDENDLYTTFEIYAVGVDGSYMRKLHNYSAHVEVPAGTENGMVNIYSIYADNADNVWVVERGEFYMFDLPEDFEGEDWERWDHRVIISDFLRVRKLDNTGAEILSFDADQVHDGREWFHISAFIVDDDENVYIAVESRIHVFDNEGWSLFTLNTSWVNSFIKTQDGTVAFSDWGERGRGLLEIDVAGKRTRENTDMPSNAFNVFQGNDEFSFIFSDNNGLYGIDAETGDSILLLDWIENDISIDGMANTAFLPDGRILIISQRWNNQAPPVYVIILLTKTERSEVISSEAHNREVLTFATFYMESSVRAAIMQFNRESTTHRIEFTDYSDFNSEDDWEAGILRLTAEIISGNIPDILSVSNLPFKQYAAKGLLVDLYPLIDSDPELSRSDFMENILRETEINGGLYRIFPWFSVISLVGNPQVVGSYPGWNTEEFRAVLEANPDADHPMGQGFTKLSYLQALFMLNMDEYVDWSTGTVSFDSDGFVDLLTFSDSFPDSFDWDSERIMENELIIAGRQIMSSMPLSDFMWFQMYRTLFGGEIVFKGWPNENRNGNRIIINTDFAISVNCKDVDAAWQFVRTFFTEDFQREHSFHGLMINKTVFEEALEEAMAENEHGVRRSVNWNGLEMELEPLTEAEVGQIAALVDSASGSFSQDMALWNIVSEGASDFFNGRSTAQDAARIIQSRASIYVSEQS